MAEIPLSEVPTITGAVICAVTDPNEETNGYAWTLHNNGSVIRLNRKHSKKGVYAFIVARSKSFVGTVTTTPMFLATMWDRLLVFSRRPLRLQRYYWQAFSSKEGRLVNRKPATN
jgi:hypothetical protein